MSYGVGCRHSSDPALLWCRLAAVALIGPLAWEPLYATGAALRRRKKERKKESKQIKPKLTINASPLLIPVVMHLLLWITHTVYAYGSFLWIFEFWSLSPIRKASLHLFPVEILVLYQTDAFSNENFNGRYFSDLWQTGEYKLHMKIQGFGKRYYFSVVTKNSTTWIGALYL